MSTASHPPPPPPPPDRSSPEPPGPAAERPLVAPGAMPAAGPTDGGPAASPAAAEPAGAPAAQVQPAPEANGLAVGALSVGIAGLALGGLFGWIPVAGLAAVFLAVVLGATAIGLGLAARRRGQRAGFAKGGIITGSLAIAIAVVWIIVQVVMFARVADDLGRVLDESFEQFGALSGEGPFAGRTAPFTPYTGEDAPAFGTIRAAEFDLGTVTLTDVEVLSDIGNDFLLRADLSYTGTEEVRLLITGNLQRGGEAIGSVSTQGTIEPGQTVEVFLTGVSTFSADYDGVTFDVVETAVGD